MVQEFERVELESFADGRGAEGHADSGNGGVCSRSSYIEFVKTLFS